MLTDIKKVKKMLYKIDRPISSQATLTFIRGFDFLEDVYEYDFCKSPLLYRRPRYRLWDLPFPWCPK